MPVRASRRLWSRAYGRIADGGAPENGLEPAYVTDPGYEWAEVCERRFGRRPVQVFHEWNSVAHVAEYEGAAGRRPLTYDEVQALFDAADGRVEEIRARGRKGALAALRDAAVLKTVYAYGLRRREAAGLDLADLRRNPKAPQYGRCGGLFVRWGKACKGSPPRRRTVLTVPEMDWVTAVLGHWVSEVRPAFGPGPLGALWVTERASRVSVRAVDDAFTVASRAAGLPAELDLHCLRHYLYHAPGRVRLPRAVRLRSLEPAGGCPRRAPRG